MSAERRLVGVDLGIASDHTVRVLREDGSEVARRRARPTVQSLATVEAAALAGAPAGTQLEVVMEPTGPAWLPVAVFFLGRGHLVFRVASAKAADLRRFLSRHAKSNGIDADTLARLPMIAPEGLQPLELPGEAVAALDRRVQACDRLTQQGALHQRRIRDVVRQLLPDSPLTGDLSKTDLAVLERWADPRALLAAGRARLLTVIGKTSHGQQGAARADAWRAAAAELYSQHPAMAFTDLAAEVATEVRLLRAVRAELAGHAAARAEAPYVICDTNGTPVDPATAKTIIAEQWTVPPEVRARLRSRKTPKSDSRAGKAPQQVHAGHDKLDPRRVDKRGDLPRDTSVLATRSPVKAGTDRAAPIGDKRRVAGAVGRR